MNTVPGYEQLQDVLQAAMDQAAKGKGAERHANDLPFHEQPMQSVSDMLDSDAGLAFQAVKKIREGRGLPHDARERELLGAINYIAGMIIFHRRNHQPAPREISITDEMLMDDMRDSMRRIREFNENNRSTGCLACGAPAGHGGLGCPTMIPVARDPGAANLLHVEPSPVVEMDEARVDRVASSHGDGEHYDAIAKTEDAVTFKTITDKLDVPAKEPRRSPEPKPKAAPIVLPNTDALVDPTGRPSWSNVPNWVNWIGQDRNGVWTGFISKPEPRAGRWFSTKRYVELNSGEALIGENWVNTLEERP